MGLAFLGTIAFCRDRTLVIGWAKAVDEHDRLDVMQYVNVHTANRPGGKIRGQLK